MKQTDDTQVLQQQMEEHIAETGISQRGVAKQLGVSDAVVSQYRRNKYINGDIEKLEKKIKAWLTDIKATADVEVQLPKDPDWVPTPTALDIHDTLNFSLMLGMQVIIWGSAGMSKTVTCRYFKEQHPNVWLITPTKITATSKGIMSLLCEALHIKPGKALSALQDDCIEKMQGSRGIIIIDEAQQLPPNSMDLMRQVAEMAGVGLAYVGSEGVYYQMMAGQNVGKFAQIYSRNMQNVHLSLPKFEDVETLCKEMKTTDKRVVKFLYDISQSPGALRYVVKTIQLATMAAKGSVVTPELIEGAFQSLTGKKLCVGGRR